MQGGGKLWKWKILHEPNCKPSRHHWLTHCPSSPLAHRATKELHSCLSPASFWMELLPWSKPLFVSTVHCHVIWVCPTCTNPSLSSGVPSLKLSLSPSWWHGLSIAMISAWWWYQYTRDLFSGQNGESYSILQNFSTMKNVLAKVASDCTCIVIFTVTWGRRAIIFNTNVRLGD